MESMIVNPLIVFLWFRLMYFLFNWLDDLQSFMSRFKSYSLNGENTLPTRVKKSSSRAWLS